VQNIAKVTMEYEYECYYRMMSFPMTLSAPNPGFKIMVLFKGEYLKTVHN